MNMNIPCPGCHTSLHVPREAAGRAARCPKCQRKFIIPSAMELLEETASHWIFEDLEHQQGERESTGETLMGVVADQQQANGGDRRWEGNRGSSATATEPPPSRSPAPKPAAGKSAPKPPVQPPPPEPASHEHDMDVPPGPAERVPYSAELQPSQPQPRLLVRDCSQGGVVLGFEPRWLEHEGFRASMPMRCAFSGVTTRSDLIARPMVFIERYRGADRSPQFVEVRYERHLSGPLSPRELLRSMNQLDSMIPPFHHIVLYYVSKHHAGQSLHCSVAVLKEGVNICEVTIPDGRVALDWLGRVNGICGDDYETLRIDVAMLGSDSWRALSERCRERLAVWCRFQPREQFRLYINDADFVSHDVGLAGVVVTDQRLIYHKYHHGGSVSLEDEAILHVKTDGQVARLTCDSRGQLSRVGKIHMKDMSRLIEALADSPNLRIQLASGGPRK